MRVIGLAGKKRVGKDQFYKFALEYLEVNNMKYLPVKIAFADKLKRIVKRIMRTSLDDSQLKKDQTPIESLSLLELSAILYSNYFAGLTSEEIDYIRSLEGQPTNVVYRKLLQYVGTEIFRKRDRFYWVNAVYEFLYQCYKQDDPENPYLVFITDVRFLNEFYLIKMWGGDVVYIMRPEVDDNDNHESEQEVELILPKCNFSILNNGSLDDYKKQVFERLNILLR